MNERLKELYKSCRSKEALASQEQFQSADVLLGTEVAKFAELIVKECATVQHKRFCEHGDVSWDILMEHFGVDQ